MADISCQELVELVTDYLEGALPREDVARFEAHLAACPGCENYLEQVRATIAMAGATVRRTDEPPISPLLAAFRDWHRSRA
jgi:anti-sigma factor RsiW